ncbi:MAG: hypothetical protein KGJ02_06195 [Verrucomicrobiota bacterium]|nr:hypothetical protein [Verrucomicrobiota bacterium]
MLFTKRASLPPSPFPARAQPVPKKRGRWLLFWTLACLGGCLWLTIESLSPHQPLPTEPPHLYSNQTQQDLRLTLVDAIRKAHESIHLVMFGLSDPAILNALAHKTIPTTIYYDSNASPKLWTVLPRADLHPVHGWGLMHQKILILDRETIFIGSANMTTASLTMHDNLVVGFKSQKLARFLIEKSPHSPGYIQGMVGGQGIELWLLPDPRGHALQDLKHKIRTATRSLSIALFTFTHPALIEEVIAAHNRGVKVHVIMDLHSSLGASNKAVEKLKSSGVRISMSRGLQLLHHKFILIDDQTLLVGSANWTKAAFYKNSDCFLILHNLTDEQKNFMHRLWGRLEAESTERRPKSEGKKQK